MSELVLCLSAEDLRGEPCESAHTGRVYPVTATQRAVFGLIVSTIEERGRAPTVREIAKAFGWSSTVAAYDALRCLQRHKLVEIDGTRHSGIRVAGVKWRMLPC